MRHFPTRFYIQIFLFDSHISLLSSDDEWSERNSYFILSAFSWDLMLKVSLISETLRGLAGKKREEWRIRESLKLNFALIFPTGGCCIDWWKRFAFEWREGCRLCCLRIILMCRGIDKNKINCCRNQTLFTLPRKLNLNNLWSCWCLMEFEFAIVLDIALGLGWGGGCWSMLKFPESLHKLKMCRLHKSAQNISQCHGPSSHTIQVINACKYSKDQFRLTIH